MLNTFERTFTHSTRLTPTKRVLMFRAVVMMSTVIFFAGCTTQADVPRPVEEEQIKNVVKDYFVREGDVPDYEVTIEEVSGNWARVHVAPAGVDNVNGAPVVYLQNQQQAAQDVPPPTSNVQPGNQARVTTTSGWTIVAGPQAHFTEAELDAAGIPTGIRH